MNTEPTVTDRMIEIARAVAAEHAHTLTEDFQGSPHTWNHVCAVEAHNGVIHFTMETNRVVSRDESKRIVRAVTLATTLAWDAAGLLPGGKYHPVKMRGVFTWSVGFWHMSQWCPTAYRRGVRVPVQATA